MKNERILVMSPTARDAELTRRIFLELGYAPFVCSSLSELCSEIQEGCGVIVLTEDFLGMPDANLLSETLKRQPAWSDLPILILTKSDDQSPTAELLTKALGNVTLLDYPVRLTSLVSAVGSSLRARRRQYEVAEFIGELERAREVLKRQAAQLEEADKRKDEFLAMLAHELRNPLAPLQNALYIIRRSKEPGAAASQLQSLMSRQVDHITHLVDDLLDVSRITTGKIILKKEVTKLSDIIERAIEHSKPLFDAKQQDFTYVIEGAPLLIEGDPVRLVQVIGNLLNNASKYTPERGAIHLSAMRRGDKAVISIVDNGIGLSGEMLPRIFDMFAQADTSLAHSSGGLGLGLTLVKRLVEKQGGSVEARSAGLGMGSTFEVQFPLLPAVSSPSRAENGSPGAPQMASKRILVVDDNRDNADSIALLLELLGQAVSTAYDGREAFKLLETFEPDVVLLDIGLPGESGFEVAKRMRREYRRKPLFLIAITGYGSEEDKRSSKASGFDAHLVKPVDFDALERLLKDLPPTEEGREAAGNE